MPEANINDDALLRALLTIVASLKMSRIQAFQLSTEVSALRDTLQELNGDKFLPILERHRKRIHEASSAIEDSMVQDIDAIVLLCNRALPEASV